MQIIPRIRPIVATEITEFARFAAGEDRGFAPTTAVEFESWLRALWTGGRSGPEHCWVAEEDGRYLEALVYWRLDNRYHIEHYRPRKNGGIGDRELLARSIHHLHAGGAAGVWAEIVSPPMGEPAALSFVAALSDMGFKRSLHRLRFRRTGPADGPDDPGLVYRSCTELGHPVFIQAWAEVSAQSLDHEIARAEREGTAMDHAAKAFTDALGDQKDSRHWELAYQPDGALVGLIAPGVFRDEPVIHYYGVAPAFRQKGLGRHLLMRGVRSLLRAGAESVRLDADAGNEPSVRAIRSCGFRQIRSYSRYELAFQDIAAT